jgi:hypothetical protein
MAGGCGKKGPPLPPLQLMPVAPAEFAADRRAASVDLRFTVPQANTDGSRPADIERVDVYAFTGPAGLNDAELLRRGTIVARVDVKAPPDPDETAAADEPDTDADPPEGPGLDQGAVAHLFETLTAEALTPASPDSNLGIDQGPLLGPSAPAVRTYAAVGVSTRGRRGPLSRRASILLDDPPPAPPSPAVAYDASKATITWPGGAAPADPVPPGLLESRPIATSTRVRAYNVYEVTAPAGGQAPQETRLTDTPVTEPRFEDARVELGRERCYVVRAVESVDGVAVESDASPPACRSFADVFAPAAPAGLTSVSSEGAVNLIWDPAADPDVAGYHVLRGESPESLETITPAPISETRFMDRVPAGRRYTYAVQAVDKSGNVSQRSATVEESAR